jgi:hypothetical protein
MRQSSNSARLGIHQDAAQFRAVIGIVLPCDLYMAHHRPANCFAALLPPALDALCRVHLEGITLEVSPGIWLYRPQL